MDKETLSNYGWIVICILVISVMIALATPFGHFIKTGVENTVQGLFDTSDKGMSLIRDITNTPLSIEELEKKYDFSYYSTLELAISDANASTPLTNADVDKENAEAGMYVDENGLTCIVLLKDVTKTVQTIVVANMSINLGGNKLTYSGTVSYPFKISGGYNFLIDGRLSGSEFYVYPPSSTDKAYGILQVLANGDKDVVINGGKYTVSNTSSSKSTYGVTAQNSKVIINNVDMSITGKFKTFAFLGDTNANVTINNSNIVNNCDVVSTSGSITSAAIQMQKNGTVNISNSNITAYSHAAQCRGIFCTASTTGYVYNINAVNSSFFAYNDYISKPSGGFSNSSQGICIYTPEGTSNLSLTNCNTFGMHSGIEVHGNTIINGGTYTGYSHGGMYLSGNHIIKNATIKEVGIPNGYYVDAPDETNNCAMYIGGGSGNVFNNSEIYIDNCKLLTNGNTVSHGGAIAARNSSGENGNKVYVSNCTFDRNDIRIDIGNKIFIGENNNINGSNVYSLNNGNISGNANDCWEVTGENYCR